MRVSQPCCPCTPQVSLTCGLSPVSMDPYGLRGLYDRRLDVDSGWVPIDGWMVVALRGDVLTNLVSSSPASLLHPDPLSQLPPRTSRHNKILGPEVVRLENGPQFCDEGLWIPCWCCLVCRLYVPAGCPSLSPFSMCESHTMGN